MFDFRSRPRIKWHGERKLIVSGISYWDWRYILMLATSHYTKQKQKLKESHKNIRREKLLDNALWISSIKKLRLNLEVLLREARQNKIAKNDKIIFSFCKNYHKATVYNIYYDQFRSLLTGAMLELYDRRNSLALECQEMSVVHRKCIRWDKFLTMLNLIDSLVKERIQDSIEGKANCHSKKDLIKKRIAALKKERQEKEKINQIIERALVEI